MFPLLLAVALAAAGPLDGEPFATSPADLLAASARIEGDQGVTILLDERVIRLDEQHRVERTFRKIFRPNTDDAAAGWGTAHVSWVPDRNERPEIHARVIHPDGTVHELQPELFVEAVDTGDGSVLEDTRVLRAPLPAMKGGVLVEQVVTLRERAPSTSAGIVDRVGLASFEPTHLMRVRLEWPSGVPLEWRTTGEVQPRVTDGRGKGRRWATLELEPPRAEDLEVPVALPPDLADWPLLEIGTGRSWSAVSADYHEQIGHALAREGLEELIDEVRAAGARTEQVLRATEIARDRVRYTAVEFGMQRIIPWTPAQVVKRGYGDCKDKAALLVTLLEAVGIDARVALLATGPGYDVPEDLPGIDLFDHAIVYLPGLDQWIDPTSRFSPPGELPLMDQGRRALLVAPRAGELVVTPRQRSTYREDRRVDVSRVGTGRVLERTTSTGWWSSELLLGRADTPRDSYLEQIRSYSQDAWGTDEVEIVETDAAAPGRFELELAIDRATSTQTTMTQGWITLPWPILVDPLPAPLRPGTDAPPERTPPWHLSQVRIDLAHTLQLPRGFDVVDAPRPRTWTFGDALLEVAVEHRDQELELRWTLDTGDGVFTPDEGVALRQAVTELVEHSWFDLRHRSAAGIERGDFASAWAALSETWDPEEPELHELLVWAELLADAGLYDASVRVAEQALALDEEHELPLAHLGWMLLLRGGPGDAVRAVELLERAYEIDPWRSATTLLRALLLSEASDVDRALAVAHEQRDKELLEAEADTLLVQGLFERGRYEELLRWTRKSGSEGVPELVAASGWMVGDRAPIRDPDLAVAAFAALVRTGHPVEAEELLKASARPVAITTFGNIVRVAELDEDTRDPLVLGAVLMRELARDEPSPERVRALFSSRTSLDDGQLKRLVAGSRAPDLDETFGSPDIYGSVVFAGSASPDVGNTQVISLPQPTGVGAKLLWAVREKRRWRVLAIAGLPETFAQQVLEALDRGDADEARLWANHLLGTTGRNPATSDVGTLRDVEALALSAIAEVSPAEALERMDALLASGEAEPWWDAIEISACRGLQDLACTAERTEGASGFGAVVGVSALLDLDRVAEAEARTEALEAAGDPLAHEARALLLAHADDWEGVLKTLERAPAPSVGSAHLLNNLAWRLLHQRRLDEALVWARKGVAARPTPASRHTLACILAAQGDWLAVHQEMTTVRAEVGELPPVWGFVEGRLAEHLGLPGDAERFYARVPTDDADPHPTHALLGLEWEPTP